MSIEHVVEGIPGFNDWKHAQRIRFFAWYLHVRDERRRFDVADLRRQYSALSMAEPGNIYQQVKDLQDAHVLLKDGDGFYLEKRVRDEFDKRYGDQPTRAAVHRLLTSLPERIPNIAERVYLKEAVDCCSVRAYRAAVVMSWNLAYDHLCTFVLMHHVQNFNERWPVRFEKHHREAKIKAVSNLDDFAEFKESQVIAICRSAGLISANVEEVLERGLKRRNSAAHPSGVAVEQLQAEEVIDDLVKNVVLKLVA